MFRPPICCHAEVMEELLSADSARGRWVLAAAVLGSGMAMLDGTVVNIALRDIGTRLDASIAELQWVVNAYMLALASLILLGGSLGDRFGRRRVFMLGVAWFATASIVCAVAQAPWQLVVARLVQGVGGALLTPGSLALIQASFRSEDRARMIGRWTGLGAVAFATGPLLGGWIVDVASWRWIFWINVPIAGFVLALTARHVPESRDPDASADFDGAGTLLGVLGLAGVTYALIESGGSGSVVAAVVGVLALVGFLMVEHRSGAPLMPLGLFADRVFSVANAMTLLVYGALASMSFFLVLQLQVSTAWSPLEAGLAGMPITVLMLLGSARSGALATRIGPRPQMAVGPLLCGVGVWMLKDVGAGTSYLTGVLPGILVFGLGLVALVAPLTASVLAAAPDRYAGLASGINNAVARTGSLLAVAALPALVGIAGADYLDPQVFTRGYERAQIISAAVLVAGGVVSWLGLPSNRRLKEAIRAQARLEPSDPA